MVVLELEGTSNMLGSGPNQYLQPDYLSPLSSPMDSKVSPLALLAQTCSQIGADGPSSKSIFESTKRKLSTCSESSVKSESDSSSKETVVVNNNSSNKESSPTGSTSSSSNNHRSKSGSSSVSPFTSSTVKSSGGGKISPLLNPTSVSPVFKPYEIPNKSKSSEKHHEKVRKERDSNEEVKSEGSSSNKITTKHSSSSSSSSKVKTPSVRSSTPQEKEKEVSVVESSKVSSASSSASSSEPIIRSGFEILQGTSAAAAAAEYNRKLSALSSLSGLGGYPPGFDPLNPAFRPGFLGPPHHSAAHALGYPIPGGSPYVSYSRVKTSSGAETIVPVCKDPYCTGCQFGGGGVPHGSPTGAALAAAAAAGFPPSLAGAGGASSSPSPAGAGGICPAGCVGPCDHPKIPLSSLPHLFPPSLTSSLASGYPSSLLSHPAAMMQHAAAQASAQQQNAQRPYVCNWIAGDNYCGKRFVSSEELLQHLRTHTNSNSSSSSSTTSASTPVSSEAAMLQHLASLSSPYSSAALLNPSAMAALRTYPTPPLSPLSAARYHPYAAAAMMAGKSALSGIPTSTAAAYYPYSAAAAALYAQRLGPSVHQ